MANSAAELIARAPGDVLDIIEDVRIGLQEGERVVIHDVWDDWYYTVDASNIPLEVQAEIVNHYIDEQEKLKKILPHVEWEDLDKLADALESRPSNLLLEEMFRYIATRVDDFDFLHLIGRLGSGSYGTVHAARIGPTVGKPHYVVKIQHDPHEGNIKDPDTGQFMIGTHHWMQEFIVAKEIDPILNTIHIMPKMYALSYRDHAGHTDRYMYLEYINGKTLYDIRTEVTRQQLYGTLAVLHSTLSYMYKLWKFVHCDFSTLNIMLRMDPSGELFDVPILDDNGRVRYYVRLPWHPMFIDTGLSVTAKNSSWSSSSSPFVTTLNDVAKLYDQLVKRFPPETAPVLVDYFRSHYEKTFIVEEDQLSNLPPIGLDIPQLSHNALLGVIEQQPEYRDLIVTTPIYNNVITIYPSLTN